jgi:hypothetical protein
VLSLPVVPAAASGQAALHFQQQSLQSTLLQLLLQQALRAAMAAAAPAVQQLLASAEKAEQAAAYRRAVRAVLGNAAVQQLVQLLAALQLHTGHAGAAIDEVSATVLC